MAQRVTITDLAREAQVSTSTVDRILSGRGQVKRITVEHVLAVAEKIGFHGSGAIRARLGEAAPERTFGFLLNSKERLFYSEFANALERQVARAPGIRGNTILHHLNEPDTAETVEALRQLGERCDAVAVVCPDHPEIRRAIGELDAAGVQVVTMVSDISTPARRVFIGSNDWQLGRMAGWFLHRLCPAHSKIGALIGSERYLCQQTAEAGFRSYLRSGAIPLSLIEPRLTRESDRIAAEQAQLLLEETPDLAAIFVAGGGLDGLLPMLRDMGRNRPIIIGVEQSPSTRAALSAGTIDVLLAHPIDEIAAGTVSCLLELTSGRASEFRHERIFPFQVLTSENS